MKAEINKDGSLHLCPENDLETYAIECWLVKLIDGPYYDNRHPDALANKIKIRP